MVRFKHFDASTVEEAVELLYRFEGKAKVIAGGTDIVGFYKDNILPTPYEALINIKTIPGLEEIKEEDGFLRIGTLVRLEDIAHNTAVQENYTARWPLAHGMRPLPTSERWGLSAEMSARIRGAGISEPRITVFPVPERAEMSALLQKEIIVITRFLAM